MDRAMGGSMTLVGQRLGGVPMSSRSSSTARWYRFDIDCAANPKGVSVRGLIREADGRRRKAKNSAAAANAFATARATGGTTAGVVEGGATPAASLAAPGNEEVQGRGDGVDGATKPAGEGARVDSDEAESASVGGDTPAQEPVTDGEPPTEPAATSNIAGPQDRGRAFMNVVERLELAYGVGALEMYDDMASDGSEGSSDNESDNGSGGDGNGGGASGEGEGDGAIKKKPKAKAKPVRRHSFDYDDGFIDDSELEKQYYAREATNKVKTVHTGFFANQGTVETVGGDSGSEGRGSGGDGGESDGSGDDADLVTRKKKTSKHKGTMSISEAGTGGVPPATKKRKVPAEMAKGTSGSVAGPNERNGGLRNPVDVLAPGQALPAGAAGDAHGKDSEGTVDLGGLTADGSRKGSKPTAPSWDPKLEAAVTEFEEDAEEWLAGERKDGEQLKCVLDSMRKLDAFARGTGVDVHNSRAYLLRLSAVCGKPPLEVKTELMKFKDEDEQEECDKLEREFYHLRSMFKDEVATSVGQLMLSGEVLAPPFPWSDYLRMQLHDMLRAFEAWSVKAHGGPRSRQALSETKSLYDQLAQEWPAELCVTADSLKKMFQNEKRRIRAKANKEAAAEASPAVPAAHAASPSPFAGGMPPPPLPPALVAATSGTKSGAGGGAGIDCATDASRVSPTQSLNTSAAPATSSALSPQVIAPGAPTTSSLRANGVSASNASAAHGTPESPSAPKDSASVAHAPSRGQKATNIGARGTGNSSRTPALSASLSPVNPGELPPKKNRFEDPPAFDPEDFEEVVEQEEEEGMDVEVTAVPP